MRLGHGTVSLLGDIGIHRRNDERGNSMNAILIEIRGGMIQSITTNQFTKNLTCYVLDYDNLSIGEAPDTKDDMTIPVEHKKYKDIIKLIEDQLSECRAKDDRYKDEN